MKKAVAWLMLLTVMTLFTFSAATTTVRAEEAWQPLFAGSPHYYSDWWWENRTAVGWVHVWNDGSFLYVDYHSDYDNGWYLTETHVAVVNDTALFPMTKKGNPKVGHFPYKHEGLDSTYDPYIIPLEVDWTNGTLLFIAAHAVVELRSDGYVLQEETAWANCGGADAYFARARGRGNWATYFNYTVQAS